MAAITEAIFGKNAPADLKASFDQQGNVTIEHLAFLGQHRTGDTYEVGIDEAGRGPVLGPMVYTLMIWKLGERRAKYSDSKVLSPSQRNIQRDKILQMKDAGFLITAITPACISTNMENSLLERQERKRAGATANGRSKEKSSKYKCTNTGAQAQTTLTRFVTPARDAAQTSQGLGAPKPLSTRKENSMNLNELSISCIISMLNNVFSKVRGIEAVYVDTVGPPEGLSAQISESLPAGIRPAPKIVVCPRADSLYNIVSCASILAKTARDTLVQDEGCLKVLWGVEGEAAKEIGSGYPSDPITKKWLSRNYDPVRGFGPFVRTSWKPAIDIINQNGERARGGGRKRN